MGEIAEMMLNGIMCQYCGQFLDVDEEAGYPMSCPDCEDEQGIRQPKISASERKIRKRALKAIRENFQFDECFWWKYFLQSSHMDIVRTSKNDNSFDKIAKKQFKEFAEFNDINLNYKSICQTKTK